jgi:uncharacterized protein YjbI with pentapeptide repeats
MPQCKFSLRSDPSIKCKREGGFSGYCIFHIPKQGKQQFNGIHDIVPAFRKEFGALLTEIESDSQITSYDFTGFSFPPEFPPFMRDFEKPVIFRSATFNDKTDFFESVFLYPADFRNARFQEIVSFWGVRFNEASFLECEFTRSADFGSTMFKEAVNFMGARFRGMTTFNKAQFEGSANFLFATFDGEVDFSATFRQLARFSGARFQEDALFAGKEDGCFMGPLEFRRVTTRKGAVIEFDRTLLNQASFTDTNLENVEFRDVTWHTPPRSLMLRKLALWDEYQDDLSYEKIAENYRQLVLIYERKAVA